jgi:hypothetical protein
MGGNGGTGNVLSDRSAFMASSADFLVHPRRYWTLLNDRIVTAVPRRFPCVRLVRCGQGARTQTPQQRWRFDSSVRLPPGDPRPCRANTTLFNLASSWFPPRRTPSQTTLTVLPSNDCLWNLARRVHSELIKDNSFWQGPLLWRVRAQVEASPSDLHHATVATVL